MLVVGNWKAFLTTSQTHSLFLQHKDKLSLLVQRGASIVICPSHTALHEIIGLAKNTGISVGAQHCGVVEQGAFTGFVTGQDLQDLGCQYSLVGHSEQRLYNGETDATVAHKVAKLHNLGVLPIVCVGESGEQRDAGIVRQSLEKQLTPVLDFFRMQEGVLRLAYEPVWSIGTGKVPTIKQIEEVFTWLEEIAASIAPRMRMLFLYGGSVSAKNAVELAQIKKIGGFLVGKASLDFQEFEKIVNCTL